ncbi:MAG: NAD(P)-dependent oxidoreductase [Crocinitomicaceae bacterium]
MKSITLGVIREGKVPPDFRVPLTPKQCKAIEVLYPEVKVVVQTSPIRTFPDQAYTDLGIEIVDSLAACDYIFGVKEVPINELLSNKTFFFFSHTFKKQPYNRNLLNAILDQKIKLVDYEVLKDKYGKRIIGFGRYAGIVGCYNAFLTYGLKSGRFELKPAHLCADRKEVEEELKKVDLPNDFRVVLTGFGRVGHGAREIIDLLPITEVSPEEYLKNEFESPVYTQLEAEDYFAPIDGSAFVKQDFYNTPEKYQATFSRYALKSDMYVPCHFWSAKSPFILTNEDLLHPENRIQVVADVSCDIAGPIACTIRPSKIGNGIYGYDPKTQTEVDFMQPGAIAVMAIDNLPCELPKDASEDFGNELLKHVLPCLFGPDPDRVIERGSQTSLAGELTEGFSYLQPYVDGLE